MNEKLTELVKTLIDKSKQKNVVWLKTNSNNEFKVILDQGATLTIDRYDRFVDLCIYNRTGDQIARYTLRDQDGQYDLLDDLHTAAREAYYKVDETIDDILKELTSKNKIGNIAEEDDLPF